MNDRTCTIRLYKHGDEKGMNDLFNLVFKKERDLKAWIWKFEQNPYHTKHVIAIAESGEAIVGMYPSLGRYYKFGNDIILAQQPVESCVRTEFRGGGRVFIRLYHEFHKRSTDLGAKFAFGFPTDDHFKVGRKLLYYKSLFSIPLLYKRLNLRLAFRNRFHNIALERLVYLFSIMLYLIFYSMKGQKGFKIERVYCFDEKYDKFWDRVSRRYNIIGVRDSVYLNWRYTRYPEGGYAIFSSIKDGEIQGYVILKIADTDPGERVGIIVDLLTIDDESVIGGLLDKAIIYLLGEGVDYAKILPADTVMYDYLIRRGFKKRDEQLNLPYQLFNKGVDESFLRDRTNWFLSYGDTDLID